VLFRSGITIQHKNQHYREVVYCPIYSFEPESINSKLLAIGETPKIDSLANVIINDKCAKEMRCKVNDSIHLTMEYEYIYYTEDEHDPAIHNYWKHDFDAIVSAIVDELDFLETPKVYYSYVALQDLAQTTFLTDLSQHYGYDISWLDLISNCSNSDAISSYNYRLFLKDARQMDKIPLINEKIDSPLSISSGALEVSEALFSLIDASTMGMEIFLVLCFGGASLILGIISFSNFTLDKKKVAILRSLGARKNDILDIYGEQCLDVGLIGVLISFVLSPLFALIANRILFQITSFHDLVQIPLVDFFGVPFLLPLAVIILTILLCFLVTWIPITFSGKISLKQELSDE
jgi:ABC-type lipoprotein release transport system permease subunit